MIHDILTSTQSADEPVCKNHTCQNEIDILKRQLAQLENELDTKKENYREALISNLRLDVEIERLEILREQNNRYAEFEEKISKQTISALNNFKDSEDDDGKFVTAVLRDLYSANIAILKMRTATGKSTKNKSAISPEKAKIIRTLFEKRHGFVDNSRLNRCIKTSIANITKNVQ